MKRHLLITLATLLGLWMLASCGGGSSLDADSGTGDFLVKPEGEKEASNGWTDPTPGDPNWRWCNIYGQWYKLGGANIAKDPPGYDPGWYMHYWLSPEACDDGWGLSELHVGYGESEPDPKKGGIPGKYDWKWEWDPVYDDMPPCEYYLYIGEFDPTTDTYFAIHSVVSKGYWDDDGEWHETANETGWGANCGGKYGEGDWAWDGPWAKKWGGWVNTESDYNLPLFDAVFGKCYRGYHWGPYSYWRVTFQTQDWYPFPGSNDWVGWCTDPHTMYAGRWYCVDVYSSYDPSLPGMAASDNWEFISYMINQRRLKQGIYNQNWSSNTIKQHFQNAVWYFKYGYGQGGLPGGLGGQFVADAKANGDNYFPGPGEWYAVILYPPNENFQMNIIEVDP